MYTTQHVRYRYATPPLLLLSIHPGRCPASASPQHSVLWEDTVNCAVDRSDHLTDLPDVYGITNYIFTHAHLSPGGIVYSGLWTGVHVAIKFLKSSSPDQLNLTAREAILSRFVSHPNVVQVRCATATRKCCCALQPSCNSLHHDNGMERYRHLACIIAYGLCINCLDLTPCAHGPELPDLQSLISSDLYL